MTMMWQRKLAFHRRSKLEQQASLSAPFNGRGDEAGEERAQLEGSAQKSGIMRMVFTW